MNDTDSDEDRLREIAHGIWEQEGRPEGQHDRHWQMAQEALAAEKAHQVSSATPAGSEPNAADDI